MISVSTRRSNTLRSRLTQSQQRISRRVEAGLYAAGEELLYHSSLLVPLDTQALFHSGHVRAENTGLGSVVVVGYGTYGFVMYEYSQYEGKIVRRIPALYAVYVHENPGSYHPQGQADYLREPTLTRQTEIVAAMNVVILATP